MLNIDESINGFKNEFTEQSSLPATRSAMKRGSTEFQGASLNESSKIQKKAAENKNHQRSDLPLPSTRR